MPVLRKLFQQSHILYPFLTDFYWEIISNNFRFYSNFRNFFVPCFLNIPKRAFHSTTMSKVNTISKDSKFDESTGKILEIQASLSDDGNGKRAAAFTCVDKEIKVRNLENTFS